MRAIPKCAAVLAIGAVMAAGTVGAALAGYDDGGTKEFWGTPAPAASAADPVSAPAAQQVAPRYQDDGYAATVNDPVYNSYRPKADRHRNRYMIQGQ